MCLKSGNGARSSDWSHTEVFGPTLKVLKSGDNQHTGGRQRLRQEILPSIFSVTGPHPPLQQALVTEKPVPAERNTISTSSLHQNYGTSFGLQTFSSALTPQLNTSNDLIVASQRSHHLCSAEAMETSQQFCSNETSTEGLNLWSADPHLSRGCSLLDSPPPGTVNNVVVKGGNPS